MSIVYHRVTLTDSFERDVQQVFETARLRVRTAGPVDVALIHALWTDPAVMRLVGCPEAFQATNMEVQHVPAI